MSGDTAQPRSARARCDNRRISPTRGGATKVVAAQARCLPYTGAFAQALFLFLEFGGEGFAEVGGFEHGADVDFVTFFHGAALQPFDGFFHRADLPHPEAGDQIPWFRRRGRPL